MAELRLPARLRRNGHLKSPLRKGSLRGAAAWLIEQSFPVEILDFFVACPEHLRAGEPAAPPAAPDHRLVSIRTMADCQRLGEPLLDRLGRQSGHGVRSIIASGGRVYALVEGGEILSQLTVDLNGPVAVETPIPLRVALPGGSGFLSYLYTSPKWRGQGLAQRLLRLTAHELGREGITRLVAHVSATNVNSQNVFLATGWQRAALVLTDRHRCVLYGGRGLANHGIAVTARHHFALI